MVIGTHGKLKNWVTKRVLEVDRITILVFDEADEMLKADAFADDSGVPSMPNGSPPLGVGLQATASQGVPLPEERCFPVS